MNQIVAHLGAFGERPALHHAGRTLTYRELAGQVRVATAELGGRRALVMIETANDPVTLVHYLATLAAGHVVLPVPAHRDHSALIERYRPDILIDNNGIHSHGPQGHTLHPDLTLVLSTSGSTGSPKLVRLSARNLIANARAIAEYLDIRDTDCAATTLPMSYCYGLSVIHSHLLRGAALLLTEHSVTEAEFWHQFRHHGATSFAGVPYTFELLDRIGFATMDLPDLRYITQAGGRMQPQRVLEVATLGRTKGWDLVVMYGATEATARMAYLPAHLAFQYPGAIGRAIPGGELSVDAPQGEVGELVYRGPNVMMGYADKARDLAIGAATDTLRTGDFARRLENDIYEIVGRADRFVKLYGLRIDLQQLECSLHERGITALCVDGDNALTVATTSPEAPIPAVVARLTGLPAAAIRSAQVRELPILPSGKPDYAAVRALGQHIPESTTVRQAFADVLHHDVKDIDPESNFVDLGGNSLTYVAMSVRLQSIVGHLPRQWQLMTVRELEEAQDPDIGPGTIVETSVLLRALAIVFIVGSHAELFRLWGGAHILLGVAGYNFGRFCLTPLPRHARARHLLQTIGWIAIPAMVWVSIALVITDDYHGTNLLLANKFLGPYDSMTAGRLWFVEVLVWTLVALTALCWMADRLERRFPLGFAAAFLAGAVVLRYAFDDRSAWFSMFALWFFAAGWAAAKAKTSWQRLAVTAAIGISIHGYFGNTAREALVLAGLTLLIWLPGLRCPTWLAIVAGLVAEASLYIYLTHFQVYALFGEHRLVGFAASILAGVFVCQVATFIRKSRLRPRGWRPAVRSGAWLSR